jgi:hypothetical protein
MKSAIASLRSLTLPFGATEGARIVLDGVNGQIRVYDNNDDLLMQLDNEGFKVFDSNGNLRIWLAIPGTPSIAYSIIEWLTARTDETEAAIISVYDTEARNRMVITPGQNADRGNIEWTLVPEDAAMLKEAMLQAVCLTLDHVDNLQPTIDLTGANSQAGLEPKTVVSDLYWAKGQHNFGSTPALLGLHGRGMIAYAEEDTDVVISPTVGTYTTIVTTTQGPPVYAGRRYRVTFSGGTNIVSGGSGFAVADRWDVKFQRSVDGGAYGDFWGPVICARAWVAIAFRYPNLPIVAYYTPAADASSVNWRVQMAKITGASTVTAEIETGVGVIPLQLGVEDVGAAL